MTDKTEEVIEKKRKCEHVDDSSDAIKIAFEAAKKIKAKLDQSTKEGSYEKLEETGESKAINETGESKAIKDTGESFTKLIDISKSKYSTFLCSASFPSLLRERLQLGPDEHFSLKLTDSSSILLSSSSEEILALAEKELKCVQETGNFRPLKPSIKSSTILKIPLGFEPLPAHISFLRGKLLGPQGSFLKHIQTTTHTRVQLRGKGSGYFEVTEPKDGTTQSQEAMHLVVEGSDVESVKEAKQLCEDLIATALSEYEVKIAPKPTIYPPPNHQMYTYPFYPPQTPQQYYAMQQAYAQYYAQLSAQYPQYPQSSQEEQNNNLEKK